MGSIKSVLGSAAVIFLGCALIFQATDGLRALTEEGARNLYIAEEKPAMPVFLLEDMNAQPLPLGGDGPEAPEFTLVEFIYTTCPTICQAAGASYAELRDRLAAEGLEDSVKLVSVSFDPLTDRPVELRDYARRHGADGHGWTVARIRPEDLEKVKKAYGIRVIPDEWGGYQHNAAIHLLDRKGRLSALYDINDTESAFEAVKDAKS